MTAFFHFLARLGIFLMFASVFLYSEEESLGLELFKKSGKGKSVALPEGKTLEELYPVPNPSPEQVKKSKALVERNAKTIYAYLPGDWSKEQLREHMIKWVNPLTGCEYLAAYTSDLIEAVIFLEEYKRIYPYEKTWFLTRSVNIGDGSIPYALFSHKGYLYIHSRLIGDQRVMPQKLTSQHIHDIENNDLMDGLQKVVDGHRKWERSIMNAASMKAASYSVDAFLGGSMDFEEGGDMMELDNPADLQGQDNIPSMEDFEREKEGAFYTFQPKEHYRDKAYPEEQRPINQMYRALRTLKNLGLPARIWRPNHELLEVIGLPLTAYLMFIYENRVYLWNPEQTYGKYIGCLPNLRVDPAMETLLVYANTKEFRLVDDLELRTFVSEGKFYAVMYTGKSYYDPLLAEYIEKEDFCTEEEYLKKIFESFGEGKQQKFAFRYMPSLVDISPEKERSIRAMRKLILRSHANSLFSRVQYSEKDIRFRVGRVRLIYTEAQGLQLDTSIPSRRHH